MNFPAANLSFSFSESSTQSVIFETLFWTCAFLVYSSFAPPLIAGRLKVCPFWEKAKVREGVLTSDAQSDMVLLVTLGLHHLMAGLLMAVAVCFNMPQLWRHGYLLENGFELADFVSMNARLYPYHNNSMKQEIKYAFIFHHLPGISLSCFVFQSGLNLNPHMQSIGMWLLLAASVSSLGQAYIHTMDFSKDMTKAALTNMANVLFFVFARFCMFPKNVYGVVKDIAASETLSASPMRNCLYVGAAFLTLFNVVIVVDLIPKMIRYNKMAWAQLREQRQASHRNRRPSFAKELALVGSMRTALLSETALAIGDFDKKEA